MNLETTIILSHLPAKYQESSEVELINTINRIKKRAKGALFITLSILENQIKDSPLAKLTSTKKEREEAYSHFVNELYKLLKVEIISSIEFNYN